MHPFNNQRAQRATILFVTLLTFFSACISTDEEPAYTSIPNHPPVIHAEEVIKPPLMRLESVPPIPAEANETTASFIQQRIDALIEGTMVQWTEAQDLNYPPPFVLFRVFKVEQELEIWAGNSDKDSLRLLKVLPICAGARIPGPKLQEGDWRTPEGFYKLTTLLGSTIPFMWIKLEENEIDDQGQVEYGSSFKLWLDYPNSVDRHRTKKLLGKDVSPGSEICVHGNCVSAGCVSFENRLYLPVFALANHHQSKRFGKPMMHVFPFRFTEELKDFYSERYEEIPKAELLDFWENLEEGYHLFEANHRAINVKSRKKYSFSEVK